MNTISNAPGWAITTLSTFAARQPLEGAEQSPITDEYKAEVGQVMAGAFILASFDEQAGFDEAMGQPGIVKTEGTTMYFEGPTQNMEAVINSKFEETGADSTVYLSTSENEVRLLGLIQEPQGMAAEGAILTPLAGGDYTGFMLAGRVGAG